MEYTLKGIISQHRPEIIRCIKEPTIVSHLEATILSPDDAKELRAECLQYNTTQWVEHLLDIVLESQVPGKLRAFLEALEKADYPYLLRLLNQESVEPDDDYVGRISIVRPDLEKALSTDIPSLIVKLESKKVTNMVDRQEVESHRKSKGDLHAIGLLLDRMQCRLSPKQWYYSFCKVLLEIKRQHLLEELDPKFLSNPSRFWPVQVASSSSCQMETDACEGGGAAGSSVREHVLTDHMDAEMSMNNLSEAPPQPHSQTSDTGCSITADDDQADNKVSNIEDNMCPLNIKPEISKPLLEEDPNLSHIKKEQQDLSVTNVKKEKKEEAVSGSDSEDSDSNPLDSDYEDEEQALFELRDYQLELAEKAVAGKNTVVCAPTGVGKTWVALHIIRSHLEADTGTRKVVFMARTGALIKQQADRIKQYLPQYQTMLLQGDTDTTKMLGEYLRDYQIFCFTPQILVNNLENSSVSSITKLSLIILDECHHTKGDSPYSILMRRYLSEKYNTRRDEKLPQVVGLTATLGVGKSSTDMDALDYIHRICALLDVTELSTVRRCKDALYKHTSKPDQETIPMQPRGDDPGSDILICAINETEEMLLEMALLQPDLIDLMHEKCPDNKESQEYNKWTHDVMKSAQRCVDDFDMSRNIFSCANYLNIYNQALEVNSLLQTADVIKFLAEKHRADSEQRAKLTQDEHKLLKNLTDVQLKLNKDAKKKDNPNVSILSGRLRDMLKNGGDDSRAMVFVKARATCKALAKFLAGDLKDIVKTSALYGKDQRGHDEGMTQAVQDETVQKFRDGEYKVIVATSIGVEGIDIPDCNMSLSYNYIGNEITKVQMRGRIRKHGGKNITMVHRKDLEKERLSAYKELMMIRAMEKFGSLNKREIEMKVDLYQKEEMQKHRFKHEVELAKKRRKTDDGDYEIRCRRCNTLACYTSDIRTIKVQHFVIDKEFAKKINIRPHKQPKVFDGFNKNRKMYCKKCPLDWGIIAEKDGLDCRILKLESFKLINMGDRAVQTYKKWIDVPYKVPEINVDDLPRLLGDDAE